MGKGPQREARSQALSSKHLLKGDDGCLESFSWNKQTVTGVRGRKTCGVQMNMPPFSYS